MRLLVVATFCSLFMVMEQPPPTRRRGYAGFANLLQSFVRFVVVKMVIFSLLDTPRPRKRPSSHLAIALRAGLTCWVTLYARPHLCYYTHLAPHRRRSVSATCLRGASTALPFMGKLVPTTQSAPGSLLASSSSNIARCRLVTVAQTLRPA